MALVPNKKDANYEAEVARMHKIAKGSDGKEKINAEFGIDLTTGDLPRKGSGQATKPAQEDAKPKTTK